MHNHNQKVNLLMIKANDQEFKDIKEVLEYGLFIEKENTKHINEIYEIASETNEFSVMEFISNFVSEQFKQEGKSKKRIEEYELFVARNALFNLDLDYASRVYIKPSRGDL